MNLMEKIQELVDYACGDSKYPCKENRIREMIAAIVATVLESE